MAYGGRSFFCILFVCCCLACCYTVLGQEESSGPVRCYFCMYNINSKAYNVTRRKQTCVDGVVTDEYTYCERFCSTYAEYDANHTQVLFVYRSCAPDASNICAAGSGREPYCEVTCTTDNCNAHNVISITSLGFIEDAATIGTTLAPGLLVSTTLFTLSRYFLGNV